MAQEIALELRYQQATPGGEGEQPFRRQTRRETWPAAETAVIVCDVWDLHHCLNAVRRLEEFGPRLNQVLVEARRRGAVIIHSPSDCMPAYSDHPARRRATETPAAHPQPPLVATWCSRIPPEEQAVYPIDQSDGGEDDDPSEHAAWAERLKGLGRNPGTPWKTQSELITIDAERDYISDRGDEVWNILQARGIKHVVLTGVHTNMCVLGRPFGLRQMVRNGMQVVLMRDMTDCMYNPKRWPYVDHFTGCDLIISHVERYVCPTVTSDQLLGGKTFRSVHDRRETVDVASLSASATDPERWKNQWNLAQLPATVEQATAGEAAEHRGGVWYRCAVRTPGTWLDANALRLRFAGEKNAALPSDVWLNGQALKRLSSKTGAEFAVPHQGLLADDANLLVVRVELNSGSELLPTPAVVSGQRTLSLVGRWQLRLGDDPSWSNIPLPARFGTSPDVLFQAAE